MPLLSKTLTQGAVELRARIVVHDGDGSSLPSLVGERLGGIQATDPELGVLNQIGLFIGVLDGAYRAVWTNTENDVPTTGSVVWTPIAGALQADLKIVRRYIDLQRFELSIKTPSTPLTAESGWTLLATFSRTVQLPTTLLWGLALQSDQSPPDLQAEVEQVCFTTPQ